MNDTTTTHLSINDRFRVALRDAAEYYDVEVRDDYSGRCMYGGECLAVSGDAEEVCQATIHAMCQLGMDLERDGVDQYDAADIAHRFIWNSDQLGRGIVQYWPSIR